MKSWRHIKVLFVLILTLTIVVPGAGGSVSALGPGSIAGTVYEVDGVTPISDIYVSASAEGYFATDCTDASGTFTLTDLPLDVELQVQASPDWATCGEWKNYLQEFWQEADNENDASPVVLSAGDPDQANIDFTLEAGGSISGTVYAADGVTTLANTLIVIESQDNLYSRATCADENGQYIFHNVALDTAVRAKARSNMGTWCDTGEDYLMEYWPDTPDVQNAGFTTLTELAPTQSGIDFTLEQGGSISGTVYEADGVTPISNIFVVAIDSPNIYSGVCTDAAGTFKISALPFDVPFRVQAFTFGVNCGEWKEYVMEYWSQKTTWDDSDFVVLTAANSDRTAINFTLDAGGAISGTTYASDGVTPLAHIAISFDNDAQNYHESICSDENGQYTLHGAPLNMPLRVRADSYRDSWCDSGGDYISEYWQEASDSASATPITLTELSSTQSGVDFTVDSAGSISGTVYEADGVTPIPNLHVSVLGGDVLGPGACTDSLGQYTIHNVPFAVPVYAYAHGGITWCGNANTYTVQFYDTMSGLSGATPLTVSEANAQLTGIDFEVEAIPTPSPDPFLRAWYMEEAIEVDSWPVGTTLTLEIEDPTTPAFPDFSTQMESSNMIDRFELSGQFDVEPGMFVVVSGASITKIMLVDHLVITEVDQVADTITGSTTPNNWMWMFFADSCCRSTVADGTGLWTFDYSVPGAEGEPVADIRPGSEGAAHVPSGDGSTSVLWRIPAKTLHVVPAYPEVHGHDWPAGTDVTLTIDDDTDPGNGVLHTETKDPDLDPWCGNPCFDLSGILDLDQDLYVTLTDGTDTKTVQISPLEVTSINLATDTVSGRADPGSRVAVNIWSQNGIARYVTTRDNGTWVADFAHVGDEDFELELADIQAGDNGRAIQLTNNGSDDGTLEYWTAELPVVDSSVRASANPTNAASVSFTVTFSDTVTGVDINDFTITKTGLADTAITKVIGSGDTYTVTVKTGSGNGTLRLNVIDNDSIRSELNIPLGGPGTGNGNFNTGEEYTVARVAPGIPVLLSPAAEALLNTLQPTFDWKDSSPTADHYQLQVATNSNFSSLVMDDTDILTSTFTFTSDLLPGELYYWRVKAFNLFDVASSWSIVRAFKTPLSQPVLVSPTEGESLTTDRPSFEWNAVDGAASYVLQVSAVSNFSTLLVDTTSNETEYSMTKDLPQNKTLFWRVRAKSSSAVTGLWSLNGTFKTGNPPTVPVLAAPTNGALLKDYTPEFNWNNATLPAGTTFKYYEIQWDEDKLFTSPVTNTTTLNDRTDSDFTPLADLASNTKYYWRVRSVNTVNTVDAVDHTSGWSPVWSFRTILPAPTGLTVTPNGSQPSFSWDAAAGPGVISGYTIQVSTSSTFGTLIVNSTTQNLFYNMTKNLPSGKTIYWRVRVNGANGPSAWSKAQFVTP